MILITLLLPLLLYLFSHYPGTCLSRPGGHPRFSGLSLCTCSFLCWDCPFPMSLKVQVLLISIFTIVISFMLANNVPCPSTESYAVHLMESFVFPEFLNACRHTHQNEIILYVLLVSLTCFSLPLSFCFLHPLPFTS